MSKHIMPTNEELRLAADIMERFRVAQFEQTKEKQPEDPRYKALLLNVMEGAYFNAEHLAKNNPDADPHDSKTYMRLTRILDLSGFSQEYRDYMVEEQKHGASWITPRWCGCPTGTLLDCWDYPDRRSEDGVSETNNK